METLRNMTPTYLLLCKKPHTTTRVCVCVCVYAYLICRNLKLDHSDLETCRRRRYTCIMHSPLNQVWQILHLAHHYCPLLQFILGYPLDNKSQNNVIQFQTPFMEHLRMTWLHSLRMTSFVVDAWVIITLLNCISLLIHT